MVVVMVVVGPDITLFDRAGGSGIGPELLATVIDSEATELVPCVWGTSLFDCPGTGEVVWAPGLLDCAGTGPDWPGMLLLILMQRHLWLAGVNDR